MRGVKAAFLSLCLAAPAAADIASARYAEPTDRYGHGAVPGGEFGALEVTLSDGTRLLARVTGGVFEDTAPRLHDFDGDGAPEVVTVFSGDTTGAMIRIFGLQDGTLTALGNNAPIGTRHRWLAVAGIADFNGDGLDEIAYVDRPHLAPPFAVGDSGCVSIVTDLQRNRLGRRLTNHKYGSPDIEGGVRICPNQPPVVVTASANWSRMMEARLVDGEFQIAPIGKYTGPSSLTAALRCD